MGTLVYLFFSNNLSQNMDQMLKDKGQEVLQEFDVEVVESFPFSWKQIVFPPDVNVFSSPGVYVQIINEKGQVVRKSRNLGDQSLPLGEQTWEKIQNGKSALETLQVRTEGRQELQKVRVYSVPLFVDQTFLGLLQVGSSLASIENALRVFRMIMLAGAFLTVILAGTFGWFMAGKSLQPIHRLVAQMSRIQAGDDLQNRIPNRGPKDEVYLLTSTINSMLGRLEDAYSRLTTMYQGQKQFVADASHELRTPLTSIRGNVDLLKRWQTEEGTEDIVKDISEELERMSRLISDLLVLARADAGYRMEMQRVNVEELIQDTMKAAAFIPQSVPLRKPDLTPVRGLHIRGNPDYLKQLFLILLENALKYTQEGEVALHVEKDRSAEQVEIRVQDTGIGMSEEETGKVFERFYRSDSARSRTGTGLGLSMAQWIVEQHHGSIQVRSKRDEGSVFLVRFDYETDGES